MIAGIVLVAFGLESTLAHVGDPLGAIPGAALLGGTALYLLAHVGFRLRVMGTLSAQRLIAGLVLLAMVPVGSRVPALAAATMTAAVAWAVIGYETWRYDELRRRVRHHA